MLSNVKNVFKISDLRNKFLFLLLIVALYRLGVAIRVPGIDPEAVKQFKKGVEQQGALGFLDLFSGGAFGSFSIFALGIMPYITASIIMQVLGVVIPKLEQLQKEGAVGQRKITQYTRYLGIGIALLQATALTFIFGEGRGNAFFGAAQRIPQGIELLPDGMWPRGYLVILTLVALYAFVKAWQRVRMARFLAASMMSIDELRERLAGEPRPYVIDVGSSLAHRVRPHIPGAVLLDLDALAQADDFPVDRDIVLYCACPREASARKGAQILMQKGYRRVRPLTGGMDAWASAGYPVEHGTPLAFVRPKPPDTRAAA